MSKQDNINKIVFWAKAGRKSYYNQIKEMYDFVFLEVFESYCEIFPFLEYNKYQISYNKYYYIWEAIKKYDLKKETCFSVFIRNMYIKSIEDFLIKGQYISKDKIPNREYIINNIKYKIKDKKNRIFMLKSFKYLTPVQLKFVCYNLYMGIPLYKISNIFKIRKQNIHKRVISIYSRINKSMSKETIGQKYPQKREKIYEIRENKIPNWSE